MKPLNQLKTQYVATSDILILEVFNGSIPMARRAVRSPQELRATVTDLSGLIFIPPAHVDLMCQYFAEGRNPSHDPALHEQWRLSVAASDIAEHKFGTRSPQFTYARELEEALYMRLIQGGKFVTPEDHLDREFLDVVTLRECAQAGQPCDPQQVLKLLALADSMFRIATSEI